MDQGKDSGWFDRSRKRCVKPFIVGGQASAHSVREIIG